MTRTARKPRPLTALQAHVLGVLEQHRCDAAEVGRHLLIEASSARGALKALEARGYCDPFYTDPRFPRSRAFDITADGEAALKEHFSDDEDDGDA